MEWTLKIVDDLAKHNRLISNIKKTIFSEVDTLMWAIKTNREFSNKKFIEKKDENTISIRTDNIDISLDINKLLTTAYNNLDFKNLSNITYDTLYVDNQNDALICESVRSAISAEIKTQISMRF